MVFEYRITFPIQKHRYFAVHCYDSIRKTIIFEPPIALYGVATWAFLQLMLMGHVCAISGLPYRLPVELCGTFNQQSTCNRNVSSALLFLNKYYQSLEECDLSQLAMTGYLSCDANTKAIMFSKNEFLLTSSRVCFDYESLLCYYLCDGRAGGSERITV